MYDVIIENGKVIKSFIGVRAKNEIIEFLK